MDTKLATTSAISQGVRVWAGFGVSLAQGLPGCVGGTTVSLRQFLGGIIVQGGTCGAPDTARGKCVPGLLTLPSTQTPPFSKRIDDVKSKQLPSQYLADVDTSDEDSLQDPRAASQHSKRRARAMPDTQVVEFLENSAFVFLWMDFFFSFTPSYFLHF